MQGVGKVDRLKLIIFLFFIAALGLALLPGGVRSSAQNSGAQQLARVNTADDSKPDPKNNSGAPATARFSSEANTTR